MTIEQEFNVRIKRYQQDDPRLGRHVRHDSRSLFFKAPETENFGALKSVRHMSAIPVLDQGDIGSCTGNSAAKCISYRDSFWGDVIDDYLSAVDGAANQSYAVGIYSDATQIDPYWGTWPPNDTGSDGLSVAKVLQSRGLISGYQHATTLNAVLTALQTQPVIVGTEWRNNMYTHDTDGRIFPTGTVQGGHEYTLDEIDVEQKRVWIQNSWGDGFGLKGRAYMTWADFEVLLKADGDCTIFVPRTTPPPIPTPPLPTPSHNEILEGQLITWFRSNHWYYKDLQTALKNWLDIQIQIKN